MGASLHCWLPCASVAFCLALAGCHARTSSLPLSVRPSASSQTSTAVQQNPAYKNAVFQYHQHDFRGALANIDALIGKPQYLQSSIDHAFLLHQQAICRHALNPRIAADPASLALIPVHPIPTPLTAAQADCGPRALLLLCPQFGIHTNIVTLRQRAGTTSKGTTLAGLANAAASLGLKPKGVQVDKKALGQLSLPAIAWYDGNHYVDLLSVSDEQATIRDPNKLEEENIPTNELLGRSGGILLTLSY